MIEANATKEGSSNSMQATHTAHQKPSKQVY